MFEIWCESRPSFAAEGYPSGQWTIFELLVREVSQTLASPESVVESKTTAAAKMGSSRAHRKRDDQLTSSELRSAPHSSTQRVFLSSMPLLIV